MTHASASQSRCEALFASTLQRSAMLTPDVVAEAIRSALRRLGAAGCAALMAQEFGDHPEQAAERMRWARQLTSQRTRGGCGADQCTPAHPSAQEAR